MSSTVRNKRSTALGFIGDEPEKLTLSLYADSDLAGDRRDCKSTSGVYLCLTGPHTFYPLPAISKKQTSVSKSSSESELVALQLAVSDEGIPGLDLWEKILGRKVQLKLFEDNQAAAQIVRVGRSPKLKDIRRTHGVKLSALHDWLND